MPSVIRTHALIWLMFILSACTSPVRVEWATATELDTTGFNVYRGASPDGPFDVKVNAELIPPAADPLVGGRYAVTDETARAGVRYYYQLQEVERTGRVNTFGPIAATASWLPPWAPVVAVVLVGFAWIGLALRRKGLI
jgi:hypothetical protein